MPEKIISWLVKTTAPQVFFDKVHEFEVLEKSAVGWTLVRPPRLVDRPKTGKAKASVERSPGASLGRADLAEFVLACAADASWVGKAPFIAG